MAKPLVIVESPAKAKTIAGFLGPSYLVESSIGHVRDLPRGAKDIPASFRSEPWANLGVDVENGFKPLYVVPAEKKSQVKKLKSLVQDASEVYLATDEDREGESIAWHLLEVLAPRVPVKRMVFHEITKPAIERALHEWRDLDRRLVDAQEARRILDRLYGYEVSPVLWKKVMPKLSAGRVQSVATRMLVERERERIAFSSATWWDLEGAFVGDGQEFKALLVSVAGRRIATGKDFSESGGLQDGSSDALWLDEGAARRLVEQADGVDFAVSSLVEKPFKRSPPPPFMTSTLQQEAGRKLRFTARRTMQTAQRLYEQGYITYMRTDSTVLSDTALRAAREEISKLYGSKYLPSSPRVYKRKVRNAQEAHEAIRPAGDVFKSPQEVARVTGADEARLYELIWRRTLASQMADASGTSAQLRLSGTRQGGLEALAEVLPAIRSLAQREVISAVGNVVPSSSDLEMEFLATGRVIGFPGFLEAYVEGNDEAEGAGSNGNSSANAGRDLTNVRLPGLQVGERVEALAMDARSHDTQPPPRYTEASLVKAMEELGVGRPSTYASIISTISDRGYAWKKGTALVPSFMAFAVVGLLERYFADLVDFGFTATMEDDLDEIAGGRREALPWLSKFYFGDQASGEPSIPSHGSSEGLRDAVATRLGEIDAQEINSIPVGTSRDGGEIVVRVGRYGPYLQRGDDRVSLPADVCPDEVSVERAEQMLASSSQIERTLGVDPQSGQPVLLKEGRFGPYVQLGGNAPGESTDAVSKKGSGSRSSSSTKKPKTASLFKDMSPETLTLEDALELLSLPRTVGVDPGAEGMEIVAQNGRFGPYLKRGTETRSLGSERQLMTVTLDEALALFAQPKSSGRWGTSASALKELGPDPETGEPMIVKSGRFGPYLTSGGYNVSIRGADTVEALTPERASELLAEKRASGPPPAAKKAVRSAKKAPAAKKAVRSAKKAPAANKRSATKRGGGA
ncbi:MAG: type I DNA topoisomerase [Actinomycetota bacterium]|nr:type I DNA topoisomerase [Actinomycetota bacterium]